MNTAARLLVEARRAAGLTQAALARKARISRSLLNVYEHGNRQPGADALASILAAAGFELRLAPRIDRERNARALAEALDLAERLPWRPRRTLPFPPFHRRARASMRDEYDFSGSTRGKYAARFAAGSNVVVLDPDVAAEFKTRQAINDALRDHVRSRRASGDNG